MEPDDDQMLYVSFNQDNSCFAVGTERGFRIYNSYPYKDYYERSKIQNILTCAMIDLDGGIGIIEMLYRSNIVALVGGGRYPKYSKNKVILWDDFQGKVISDLSFNSYISNIKMKKDRIFVVCDTKIYLFNLLTFQTMDTIDTFENTNGIIAVTYDQKVNLLAFPDKNPGVVRIKNYDKNDTFIINAHDNHKLACLAFSPDGRYLATSSEIGRSIRIFKADDGVFIYEFRRGKDHVEIFSLSFDQTISFISCCTSTGIIHIFSLEKANEIYTKFIVGQEKIIDGGKPELIQKEEQTIWQSLFNKTESAWAIFRIPENKSITTFISGNMIIVIGSEGRYYVATFDTLKPCNCIKTEELSLNINPYITY